VFVKRSGEGKPDGCAIAWRSDRWEMLAVPQKIDFNEEVKPYLRSNAQSIKGQRARFERHNVALIVMLRHQVTGRELIVANAHLFWNPMYEDIKLAQAVCLVKMVEQFIRRRALDPATTPHLICGDFNALPSSDVYRFLSSGFCTPATLTPNPSSRLLLLSDMSKVARWLRALGCDVGFYEEKFKLDFESIFATARREHRIIVCKVTCVFAHVIVSVCMCSGEGDPCRYRH
jgi:hypothetical protein